MINSSTYGLTHLAIAVKNIHQTLQFYTSVFGMKPMYQEEKMIQLTTPGNHDILVFEEKPDALIGQTGGIAHFGFRLRKPSDIDEIRKQVDAAKAEIIDSGEFVPGSPYLFFKDPDGYVVEVWYESLPAELAKEFGSPAGS